MNINELEKFSVSNLKAEEERLAALIDSMKAELDRTNRDLRLVRKEIIQRKYPGYGSSVSNRMKNLPILKKTPEKDFEEFRKKVDDILTKKKPTKVFFTPEISDHAMIRYLERVKNFDVDAVKKEIMTKDISLALSLGASRVFVNKIEMRAVEGKIVTIIA